MANFFHAVFYQPILNALVLLYDTVALHDFGFAVILVTILIRLVLYPLFHKSTKQQMVMQRIQPKIQKIQQLHKNDREKQTQALMALYEEHGVNPFSSMLLLIVQLPIMIGLFYVVRGALAAGPLGGVYSFIPSPGTIDPLFLHLIDLSKPSMVLIALSAIAQYFQARLAIYRDPQSTTPLSPQEKMARQMAYIGPLITIFIFYSLPSAVALYWLVTSVFSIFQQIIINRHMKAGETAAI